MRASVRLITCALLLSLGPASAVAQGTRATIAGTVSGVPGTPQANVTMVLTNEAGVDRRVASGPTGEFVLGGLLPGTYRLRVDDDAFAPWSENQIVLAAGERRVIAVALQSRTPPAPPPTARATMSGTVFGPDGRPRANVTVVIVNTQTGVERPVNSGPVGEYVFGGLVPGTYRVRAAESDARPFQLEGVALGPGERRLVDVRLQPLPPPPPVLRPNAAAPPPSAAAPPVEAKASKARRPSDDPSAVAEVTATDGAFEAAPDRWRFKWPTYQRYAPPQKMPWIVGGAFDPYNQNAAKADYPIGNSGVFANVTLQFNNNLNPRKVAATANGVDVPQQLFYNQNLVGGLELFKGDTVFQPKAWAIRATAVLNINATTPDNSLSIGSLTRFNANKVDDPKYALEEAFVEKRLAVLSPAFDFVSVRGGMQNFNSDFRGYLFVDNQLGVRLFGNARSNRDQYNVAYFSMRNRDAFSQLHDFGNRNQDVIIANYYIQDFGAPGYTGMFNVHVNRDRGAIEAGGKTPVPLAGAEQVTYLGFHGDGHWGPWSVSHAFYQAFGTDDNNVVRQALNRNAAPAPVDISAQMAAIELSRDSDWVRYRASLFYASGDDGADPTKAKGFDSITDNPNVAGGQFMFWTQQQTKVSAVLPLGGLLSEKFTLLPNLRSKFTDRSNFVNPGLILLGGGVDLRLSPQIKLVTNASYLRFATAADLRQLSKNSAAFADEQIGLDFSAGAKIRPFTNENLFVLAGVSFLRPRGGFAAALPAGTSLYSLFGALQIAY